MYSSAVISECGTFRYELVRSWDNMLPQMIFVMLNPSTADHETDDNTIRKDIGFAKRNGCGSIRVYNIWAYRATDPKGLEKYGWKEGHENRYWLSQAISMGAMGSKIVCAWGANARNRREPLEFIENARRQNVPLYALGLTLDGIPRHPLYLRNDSPLIRI